MPDETLQVIRYSIEPQIPVADKAKPWVWMDRLRIHYTGTATSSLLTDAPSGWPCSVLMSLYKTGRPMYGVTSAFVAMMP